MGRISGKDDKRDGYGRNLTTGKPIDDRDAYAIRGSLRFKPTDTLDMVLMADYFKEDDYNYAFHFFGTTVVPEDNLAHNLLGGRTIFDYYGAGAKSPTSATSFPTRTRSTSATAQRSARSLTGASATAGT